MYSNSHKSIKDIKDGSTVSIANDGSNPARSFSACFSSRVSEARASRCPKATVDDFTSNPKNLKSRRPMRRSWPGLTPSMWLWCRATTSGQPNSIRVPRSPWKQDDGVIEVFVVRTQNVDSDFGKHRKKRLSARNL
ncbi:MAG: MetQ/NlpA family ABC transporter substrate-binding protein [Bifidobacterium pseudocatenulatum]